MIEVGQAHWPKGCQGSVFKSDDRYYLDPKLKNECVNVPDRFDLYGPDVQEIAKKLYDRP